MSSGVIQIGQSAISTQAKNTIQDDIDAIIEIITNSADELFGKEFTDFMEERIGDKYPAIPTVEDFNAWKEYLGDNKIGEITIAFRTDYTEISDTGGGIPCDYIESRIKKFGRDVSDQIDMSNSPDFHRRGQFSRGLKEVLAWLHSNDPSSDSSILVETVFKNENGKKRSWTGKYIVNDDTEEPYYFELIEDCHQVDDDIPTGTSVKLHYPGDFRIHSSSMLKKLRRHYKLQRIFEEHNVYFSYKEGGKDKINPYLSNYELDILYDETKSITIPDDQEVITNALSGAESVEYNMSIYRVNLEDKNQLRPQYPSSGSGINIRGVYVGDHTTIYGRLLPGDNVLGTEQLQAKIIFPALRVFSVLGSSIDDFGLPAFTPSDRKDPNFQHPAFQLIYEDIRKAWLEIVEEESERMEEELQRIEDEKTKLLERSVVRKLNDILNSELQEAEGDEEEPDLPDESLDTQAVTTEPRKKTIFGPQRIAYGDMINLYPGRRRRLVSYIHDDLVNFDSNGELIVRTSKPILIDEQKSMRTKVMKLPFSHSDTDERLHRFALLFQPSLDIEPPMNINIRFGVDLDTLPQNLRSDIKGKNEIKQILSSLFETYHIPDSVSIEDDQLIMNGRINISEDSPDRSGLDYIEKIVFETEETIEQNNREFDQNNLDRGWDITPVPSPNDPDEITYIFRVYCRSPYFCDTFDPSENLPSQPLEFITLLATALSSAVAQAVIENTEQPSEMSMDVHSEKINAYIPTINRILSDPELMSQVI